MSHDDPVQPSPEPLRLLAQDEDDLQIVSAALQDAILRPRDVVWEKAARRLTGDLRVDLECVDVVVADLTPRWPAQAQPAHPDAESAVEPESRA